jgi:hypothetical protein
MRSLSPIRFLRALARHRSAGVAVAAACPESTRPLPATRRTEPTVYADGPLSRVLVAMERRASDLELALAEYVRARRAAGVQPEVVLVEFKRVLCRAVGLDVVKPRLTGRLIELYFAV